LPALASEIEPDFPAESSDYDCRPNVVNVRSKIKRVGRDTHRVRAGHVRDETAKLRGAVDERVRSVAAQRAVGGALSTVKQCRAVGEAGHALVVHVAGVGEDAERRPTVTFDVDSAAYRCVTPVGSCTVTVMADALLPLKLPSTVVHRHDGVLADGQAVGRERGVVVPWPIGFVACGTPST